MVNREGKDADSTRRVRSKLAQAMKSPLDEQEVIGTKPKIKQISEDAAVTETGLLVPAQAGEGLVVP